MSTIHHSGLFPNAEYTHTPNTNNPINDDNIPPNSSPKAVFKTGYTKIDNNITTKIAEC